MDSLPKRVIIAAEGFVPDLGIDDAGVAGMDSSLTIEVPGKLPINLDGELYRWDRIAFEVRPKALRVVLPEGCPVIQGA